MIVAENKTVYILVGPKGSGKSYIGSLIGSQFSMRFLRVEPLLIAYTERCGVPIGGLKRDGFDLEEEAIHSILATDAAVILEATGSSVHFSSFLDNLRINYRIRLVRIRCPLDTCLDRIRNRDTTDHFPVADELIVTINKKAADLAYDWDLEIDNSGPASADELVAQFARLISSADSPDPEVGPE